MPSEPLARVHVGGAIRAGAFALAVGLSALPSFGAYAAGPTAVETTDTPSTFAYDYGEVETPRSAALGGALRAAGNGSTGLFLNPANIALTRLYHIEAIGQITPEVGRQVYGGAIVDSTTNRLAGGTAITGGFMDPSGTDRSWMDIRLGLAFPVNDSFFIGLGGRYLKLTENGFGPFGNGSKASGGLKDSSSGGTGRFALVNIPTFDAGVTLKLANIVHIGLTGQNLTYPNNGYLPTTAGGGVAVATQDFTIEADAIADFNSYLTPTARVMAGGEYLLINHIPLRAGYRYDQGAKSHQLSAGVGYIAREFSIEASVRRTLNAPNATMIYFGAAYFLESSGLTKAQPDY
jgi:hypothetical protein